MTKINHKWDLVTGDHFDTDNVEMVCVPYKRYGTVRLCVTEGVGKIPFANIELSDHCHEAQDVFDDAVAFGNEICRRWNEGRKDNDL